MPWEKAGYQTSPFIIALGEGLGCWQANVKHSADIIRHRTIVILLRNAQMNNPGAGEGRFWCQSDPADKPNIQIGHIILL